MTKPEAINCMLKGEKLTHTTFTPDEWITMKKGYILTEEGYTIDPNIFWSLRSHENFETDWSIWDEN